MERKFLNMTLNIKEIIYIILLLTSILFNYFALISRVQLLEYKVKTIEENNTKITRYLEQNNLDVISYKLDDIQKYLEKNKK